MEAFLTMAVGLTVALLIVGVSAVLIVCAYRGVLFLREVAFKGDAKRARRPKSDYQRGWDAAEGAAGLIDDNGVRCLFYSSLRAPDQDDFDRGWRDCLMTTRTDAFQRENWTKPAVPGDGVFKTGGHRPKPPPMPGTPV